MAFNKKQFCLAIRRYKEGLIIGGLVGAIAAYYSVSQGYDYTSIGQASKGLLDLALGRSALPSTIAQYKLYGVFISVGAAIGFAFDMLIDKYKLYKK